MLAVGPAGRYATEGRGYALVLCGTALAALAWQRRNLAGLAGALALAISAHYFGVFLVPVFLAASIRRDGLRIRRELTAVAAGVAPLLFYAPLMAASFGPSVGAWTKGIPHTAELTFTRLLMIAGVAAAQLLFPLLIAVPAWIRYRRSGVLRDAGAFPGEIALAAGLVLYPLAVLIPSYFVTGVFLSRYAIPWTIGLAMLASALYWKICRKERHLWGLTAITPLAMLVFPALYLPQPRLPIPLLSSWLAKPEPSLPLVYADPQEFEELWYYAPSQWRSRLCYLTDPRGASSVPDPAEGVVVLHAQVTPLPLYPYEAFLRSHGDFLLLSSSNAQREWLPGRLRRSGYVLEELTGQGPYKMFRVSAGRIGDAPELAKKLL